MHATRGLATLFSIFGAIKNPKMITFKRWMVGLDLTGMDHDLITYIGQLAEIVKPDKIYFLNIQQHLDVEDDLKPYLSHPDMPLDEHIKNEMKERVERNFPGYADFDTEFTVIEGSPTKELLKWVHIKEVDLVLMGRKKRMNGSGVIPQQVARKCTASIWFVPDDYDFKLDKVMAAIDFSDHAAEAVNAAAGLREGMDVELAHIVSLPSGYYAAGKSEEEFVAIMKRNAQKDFDKFKKNLEGDLSNLDFKVVHSENPVYQLYAVAKEDNVDLIVIGARGRTFASAIFLGSMTEKLIGIDADTPLLVVKRKDTSFDFWEMIKKL